MCEEPECADCFVAYETAEELRRHYQERHSGGASGGRGCCSWCCNQLMLQVAGACAKFPAVAVCVHSSRIACLLTCLPTHKPAHAPLAALQPACRGGTPAVPAPCSSTSPTPAARGPPLLLRRLGTGGSARGRLRTSDWWTTAAAVAAVGSSSSSSSMAATLAGSGPASMHERRMAGCSL
jgi:hypothetical protein